MNNLKIELEPREDENQQIYYVGKLNSPVKLNCANGLAFLIFLSDQGAEELQIAFSDGDNNFAEPYQSKGKTKIRLDRRKDRDQKVFYLAKIKCNGELDCSKEPVSFLVFVSKPHNEMLQIGAPLVLSKKRSLKTKRTNQDSVLISETYVESSLSDAELEQLIS